MNLPWLIENIRRISKMACPYLKEQTHSSCVTKNSFHPRSDYLINFCKNTKKFNKCATYKEWMRIQGAPKIIKLLVFAIPILFYLNLLSLAIILELIKINDSITYIFGFISLIIGAVLSLKA